MRNRPLLTIAVIIIISAISFALIGIVRDYIAPWVLSMIWRAYLMADSIPQVMIWAIFVAAIPLLAIFVLIQGRTKIENDVDQTSEATTGQVFHWIKQIQRSSTGDYFKRSFIRQLSELTFATLKYRERMSEEEVKQALNEDYFPSGSEIAKYLSLGWRRDRFRLTERKSGIRGIRGKSRSQSSGQGKASWQDPRMEQVIEFLETELEV